MKSGLEDLELWCGHAKEEVIYIHHAYIHTCARARAHTHILYTRGKKLATVADIL